MYQGLNFLCGFQETAEYLPDNVIEEREWSQMSDATVFSKFVESSRRL